MADEAELLKAFEDKGVVCGSELIVLKDFCNDFMQASKLAGFAVIGIEGFHLLIDGSVQPDIDEIADFSDIEGGKNLDGYIEMCFEAAKNFIGHMLVSGKSDGYCFTLTDSMS